MSHEIYYISAPEGLRPGQQGFCTVATSAGIPRPLWDRLESVSGYRHPFGAAPGRSPVAWAHWLMDVGGREVSVLSRLCDSGLDYTQRTNAFAHHIALEPEERAAAGPAWMLRQDGVMARQWDGRVGTINRSLKLPRGDVPPAPCAAWQRMTGDAGWAGVLAETAFNRPRKPVCILFNAGYDMLPLIAEAIALLPARLRWQVTFNTYFTSAPGTAVCAWRCCLAQSPAAQEAIRRAGGSLVLDLTNPAQLGIPPAGAWVDAARSGRCGAADGAPTAIAQKPASRMPAPRPPPAEVVTLDLRPPATTALAASASGQIKARAATTWATPVPTITPADEARPPELPWDGPIRQPRRNWIVAVCALAFAFIGVGTWLRLTADRDTNVHALPAPLPSTAPAVASAPNPAPVWPFDTTPSPTTRDDRFDRPDSGSTTAGALLPASAAVAPTQRPLVTPAPLAPQPANAAQPGNPAGDPTPPAATSGPPTSDAPVTSVPVVLSDSLRPPVAGAGVRDPSQSFALSAESLTGIGKPWGLQVLLPGRQAAYALNTDDLSGTLTVAAVPHRALRQAVVWRDAANPALSLDVATLLLEPSRNSASLQVLWKTATLIKRPAVSSLALAILQNSALIVADTRQGQSRELGFKPIEPLALDIGQARSGLAARPVPVGTSLRIERGLAAEWGMSAAPEWESGAAHTAERAGWALHFKGPAVSDHAGCEFDVHIAAGWGGVQSNWSAQRDGIVAAESSSADDLKHLNEEIDQQKSYAQADLDRINKDIADALSDLKLSDDELTNRFTSRPEVHKRLAGLRQSLEDRRKRLDQAVAGIMSRRADAERGHGLLAAGVKAFDEVNNVELIAELPGGVRAAAFRLIRQ
jgi:hypothetical protein